MSFYRHHVFCCTNVRPDAEPRVCCGKSGSDQVREYLKTRAKDEGLKDVRINTSGCLNRCELGPVVVIYPDDVWYRCASQEDAEEILQSHLIRGEVVTRLRLPSGKS
ncbi:MAG: 2Fe-2S ferredoxin [Alphaproteobacteria bacterium RIFOXYD12_FULL_60_8]|nr:MAG: 2Fe-2S ferredoxin [Alphaproteobacteria bacterium RIFOXYD12_FULL_60_8]